jgi:hypothetical protein
VELLMAVEEGDAWVVGLKFDFGLLVSAEHDDVFQNTGGGLAGDASQLETMTM